MEHMKNDLDNVGGKKIEYKVMSHREKGDRDEINSFEREETRC